MNKLIDKRTVVLILNNKKITSQLNNNNKKEPLRSMGQVNQKFKRTNIKKCLIPQEILLRSIVIN